MTNEHIQPPIRSSLQFLLVGLAIPRLTRPKGHFHGVVHLVAVHHPLVEKDAEQDYHKVDDDFVFMRMKTAFWATKIGVARPSLLVIGRQILELVSRRRLRYVRLLRNLLMPYLINDDGTLSTIDPGSFLLLRLVSLLICHSVVLSKSHMGKRQQKLVSIFYICLCQLPQSSIRN